MADVVAPPRLHWLLLHPDWRGCLRELRTAAQSPASAWAQAVVLANTQLDFVQTNALDKIVREVCGETPPDGLATRPVRLALLGSATLAHLHASLRVAALRRGIWLTVYENDYGQYMQELLDRSSALHDFRPNAVLFAFDARHVTAGVLAGMAEAQAGEALDALCGKVEQCWTLAREAFRCPVLQQTVVPAFAPLLGSNEHRLPGSRTAFVARVNAALRSRADAQGVDLVSLDARIAGDGLHAWHDPALWHHAKQEVTPAAAPVYGDLVARVIAARHGRSYKCLVLDLDNTIWGGVIGDDGVDGIVLGQGSALGEAFIDVQEYAAELSRRGIILAVCSKNEEANAFEAFEKHPEMVLRRGHIASFVANWNDKAANIRTIAAELNIGLDALVLLDDNPFERALIRRELPMVAVPELPEDPAGFAGCLADAGYFEAVAITEEDRERTRQYQSVRAAAQFAASATDMDSYLRGLEMVLLWRRFDRIGLQRIVQLINKTNQFNLTTRRYTEDEVIAVMEHPSAFGVQLRLVDRFGDHGIIAIVIGRLTDAGDLVIDTWLMSCRVLGRQVEATTVNIVADQARRLGAKRLVGEYRPTKKNGMVRDHYDKLGFTPIAINPGGCSQYALALDGIPPLATFIETREG